jgi:ornithine carbamoyltransferase
MPINLRQRDLLKLLDFTSDEIRYLIDLSISLKAQKRRGVIDQPLKGKSIAILFQKTSTRTRCSFEVAAYDLGMNVTYIDSQSSQFGVKESVEDSAKVLARFYDGIEFRGFKQTDVEALAKYADVPV